MSSFLRRMQRAAGPPMRNKPSGIPNFGIALGVTNPKAKDLLARLAREPKRAAARAVGDPIHVGGG